MALRPPSSDGLRSFEYDEANRPSVAKVFKDGEEARIRSLHNAWGQRVFKGEPEASQTLPSETTLGQSFIDWLKSNFRWMFEQAQANTSIGTAYIYDEDGSLLGEYDNGSAKAAGRTEYIWLPTESGQPIPVGIFRNGNFFAIHSDHLGTPRLMTNEDNKPVWQWPYSAFGANKPTGILQATPNPRVAITNQPVLLKATAATELNLRFPGQYFDSETNLHYNYFRSYQPNQGRYTQADPIGLDGGVNRFGYVGGNPLTRIDPTGLDFLVVTGGARERSNPFGHTAVGVTGAGIYSYGNNTELGSGPLSYITDQAQYRDQTITIIPRTPAQDQAALDNLSSNSCKNCVGILDNCAVRTDSALRAGGVNTGMWPFPGGVARDAMRVPGATTYYVPRGGLLPQGLVDALRPFNPPNVP